MRSRSSRSIVAVASAILGLAAPSVAFARHGRGSCGHGGGGVHVSAHASGGGSVHVSSGGGGVHMGGSVHVSGGVTVHAHPSQVVGGGGVWHGGGGGNWHGGGSSVTVYGGGSYYYPGY